MNKTARLLIALLAVVCLATSFYGCNTWRGMGEDVETMGEGMQSSAK